MVEKTSYPVAVGPQNQTPVKQSLRSPWKVKFLKTVFLFVFLGVLLRLIHIQIIESPKYQQIAQRQYETKVAIPAVRGSIFDRNGNLLASHSMFVSFGADPKAVGKHTKAVADRFARVFHKPVRYYTEKLESGRRFVWLERQVRPALARLVQHRTLPGVIELNEAKRLYHYPDVGGALIGFTDVDNVGLSGVELQFDEHLRGTDGYVIMQRDGRGQARPSADYLRVEPRSGNDIMLTIDLVYQSIAEEKLRRGVERTNAEGGLVVMMHPPTGEILAMAQYPPLDPTSPASAGVHHQKLRAVTDMFEPGSVFKIVTAAAALEDGLVQLNQRFDAEQGRYTIKFPDGRVRTIRDTHVREVVTFQEAMEISSNIVMAKVSDLVGSERLYTKARSFGFGAETGIEYPGEAKGDLKRPIHWSGTTLNTMAYGYEVGATPLQITAAYATIANRGYLMRPLLVKKIVAPSGETIEERTPEQIRRVTTPEVASTITGLLMGVVERGTGLSAKIQGVHVAGKTGTSRKYSEGQYQTGNYTASFVGFFPVENPEVVCLVMLDNPSAGGYTGGATAAPIFREIAQQIIATGKAVVPTTSSVVLARNAQEEISIPDVVGLRGEAAVRVLESRGLIAKVYGEGIVVKQVPSAGRVVDQPASVTLVLNGKEVKTADGGVVVPDLVGLSVRRAANRLAVDGLQANIHGSGIVIDQMPAPGTIVSEGAMIVLVCESRPLAEQHN